MVLRPKGNNHHMRLKTSTRDRQAPLTLLCSCLHGKHENRKLRTSKTVQQVMVFAVHSDGLSSIPGTHRVEGKNQLLQAVFWSLHTSFSTCMPKHKHRESREHHLLNTTALLYTTTHRSFDSMSKTQARPSQETPAWIGRGL